MHARVSSNLRNGWLLKRERENQALNPEPGLRLGRNTGEQPAPSRILLPTLSPLVPLTSGPMGQGPATPTPFPDSSPPTWTQVLLGVDPGWDLCGPQCSLEPAVHGSVVGAGHGPPANRGDLLGLPRLLPSPEASGPRTAPTCAPSTSVVARGPLQPC